MGKPRTIIASGRGFGLGTGVAGGGVAPCSLDGAGTGPTEAETVREVEGFPGKSSKAVHIGCEGHGSDGM